MKIYADGADLKSILGLNANPLVEGFTTNPTLLRKDGVTDYEGFAKAVLEEVAKPVSFEVFADEFDEMERQARIISSWAENVYVKIPITNTQKETSLPLIQKLYQEGIKLNITALMSTRQVVELSKILDGETPTIVSVFAGRIADTGRDPIPFMRRAKIQLNRSKNIELLWASPREVLNIYQAKTSGADIITCSPDLILKYQTLQNKDLEEFSLETVQMFYSDGKEAGYEL